MVKAKKVRRKKAKSKSIGTIAGAVVLVVIAALGLVFLRLEHFGLAAPTTAAAAVAATARKESFASPAAARATPAVAPALRKAAVVASPTTPLKQQIIAVAPINVAPPIIAPPVVMASKDCAQPRPARKFKSRVGRVGDLWVSTANCSFGWGPQSRDGKTALSLGQNLEDAVIVERFFRGGPLAKLGTGVAPGVFVEMGALDGILFSNSMLFEHCLGWSGLLIEGQPANAKHLLVNRPCTKKVAEAVCAKGGDGFVSMSLQEGTAYDLSVREGAQASVQSVKVPCRPLSEILAEHSITRINFFSLDVEGAELKVLQTFDWSKVKIDVLMVEADFLSNADSKTSENKVIMMQYAVRVCPHSAEPITVRSIPSVDLISVRSNPSVDLIIVRSNPSVDLISVRSIPSVDLIIVRSIPSVDLIIVRSIPSVDLTTVRSNCGPHDYDNKHVLSCSFLHSTLCT
jgi:FkbM family methyltransferase